MADYFKTIKYPSKGSYKALMSRFLAFAQPVITVQEAKDFIKSMQNQYHDARHCCWAYMIGTERDVYLCSDNGEPSGTAGRPILGQINSFELTNVVVCVIRYYGGINLGTSGLIEAYRQATRDALQTAEIIECHEQATLNFTFDYEAMNSVMRIIKADDRIVITDQVFDNLCQITIRANRDMIPDLAQRFGGIQGVYVPATESQEPLPRL